MAFFDKLGDNITNKSKDLAKKAKDLSALAKLNSQISSYEDTIDKTYLQIGKLYYEESAEVTNPLYLELFKTIQQAQVDTAQVKKEISKLKGTHQCTNCGAEIPVDAIFCSVCGAKNEIEQPEVVEAEGTFCPNCGTKTQDDSAFCPNCGEKI